MRFNHLPNRAAAAAVFWSEQRRVAPIPPAQRAQPARTPEALFVTKIMSRWPISINAERYFDYRAWACHQQTLTVGLCANGLRRQETAQLLFRRPAGAPRGSSHAPPERRRCRFTARGAGSLEGSGGAAPGRAAPGRAPGAARAPLRAGPAQPPPPPRRGGGAAQAAAPRPGLGPGGAAEQVAGGNKRLLPEAAAGDRT